MNDQDEKPAFIVDPDGTVYDVRKKKDSQGSSSSNIPPREPPTNKSYSRPTPKPTGNLSINPIGLILFVISIIFFVARSVIYVQVSRNTPTRPAGYSYYSMGNNYYSQGRHEEAITQYNLAIKMDPDFGEAYNNRGLVYMDTGKYEEARADFENVMKLNTADEVRAYALERTKILVPELGEKGFLQNHMHDSLTQMERKKAGHP